MWKKLLFGHNSSIEQADTSISGYSNSKIIIGRKVIGIKVDAFEVKLLLGHGRSILQADTAMKR